MDAIDVAAIKSDGEEVLENLGFISFPMPDNLQDKLKATILDAPKQKIPIAYPKLESEVTKVFIQAIEQFIKVNNINLNEVDLIGNHGQTIIHLPEQQYSLQLSNNQEIANHFKVDVIGDFRKQDLQNGGQGAPLVPLYHASITKNLEKPIVILNLGGVGNLTYINDNKIIAFDTGPANALINDYMQEKFNLPFDENGKLALAGKVNEKIVEEFLREDYFNKKYPKSLDRNEFSKYLDAVSDLIPSDAAATLSMLTIASAVEAYKLTPQNVTLLLVAGGGRFNNFIVDNIRSKLDINVVKIEYLGVNGDAIEAETFAYLAIRSKLNLPISLPTTTGVTAACSGGVLYQNQTN